MIYHRQTPIEFNHCDPAGIVFYPRYFEMTNSVVENFFREIVQVSFAQMMQSHEGVPTARAEVDFHAPSRLGEVLDWQLGIRRIGQTSVSLCLRAICGQPRVTAGLVLVRIGHGGRPLAWSDAMRAAMSPYKETADA